MDQAIEKVNELIAIDMGSLVEEKKGDRRERVSMPFAPHVFIANYSIRSVNGLKKRYLLD